MGCARPGTSRPAWSHPGTAQEPRRRPQDRPREAQDSPKRPQEASRSALSKRFWTNSGGPGASKNLKKCCTVVDFQGFRDFAREPSTEAPKAPKGAPREAQMSPRRAPGGPRSGPKKRRPRPPQAASREASGTGSPFWPHLGAPGASFSSLLGVPFEPRARPARQTNGRNHLSKGLSRPLRSRCAEAIVHLTCELVATGQQIKKY